MKNPSITKGIEPKSQSKPIPLIVPCQIKLSNQKLTEFQSSCRKNRPTKFQKGKRVTSQTKINKLVKKKDSLD